VVSVALAKFSAHVLLTIPPGGMREMHWQRARAPRRRAAVAGCAFAK
jgi:hypothetical protein